MSIPSLIRTWLRGPSLGRLFQLEREDPAVLITKCRQREVFFLTSEEWHDESEKAQQAVFDTLTPDTDPICLIFGVFARLIRPYAHIGLF